MLDATGPGALDELADVIGERDAAVGETAEDRRRLWAYRERHPEALFARIRHALDPAGTLNPHILPRA